MSCTIRTEEGVNITLRYFLLFLLSLFLSLPSLTAQHRPLVEPSDTTYRADLRMKLYSLENYYLHESRFMHFLLDSIRDIDMQRRIIRMYLDNEDGDETISYNTSPYHVQSRDTVHSVTPPTLTSADFLFGGEFAPSLFGAEFPYNKKRFISFTIYQGFSVPTWHLCFGGPNDSATIKFIYHGGYDFDITRHSGPVISRLQNPMAYFEGRVAGASSTNYLFNLGFAHESNGMFLEDTAQARVFAAVHPESVPQDYASMGWNYSFLRLFRTSTLEQGTDFCGMRTVTIGMELRFHVSQHSGETLLEDSSLFIFKKPVYGFRSVDGLRLSVFTNHDLGNGQSLLIGLQYMSGELMYAPFRYNSVSLGLYPTVNVFGMSVPLYAIIDVGYRHSIARYPEFSRSLAVGIRILTESLTNGVVRSITE